MRGLVLMVALSACGGAGATPGSRTVADDPLADDDDPADDVARGLGLHPGEAMTFEVSLAGVLGGEAAIAVGEPGEVDGKPAIVVTSRVASAGALRWVKVIEDNLTTTIDMDSGLPIRHVADSQLGARYFHSENEFDGAQVDLDWHQGDGEIRHKHYNFRDVVAHDAHTAMASLRTWEGEDGETRRLYLVGGRRIWLTDVTWVGREVIATALGNQATIRLEGTSTRVTPRLKPRADSKVPRKFTVWLTDDGDRAPVLVAAHTELGDIRLEMTSYKRP